MNNEVIVLEPVFTSNIWGGTRLKEDFFYTVEGETIGECWGIAANEDGDCTIADGIYKGQTLSWLYQNHRELFGEIQNEKFPLLVKIIDAKQDLSIQVHPNDSYAKKNENGAYGKMECWYILDCDKDASLVIGHNARTKAELESMIGQHEWKKFIREIPVKKGDFIQIDPGTVHAIKGGILLLETQQNSNVTYRVYDYDRLENGKKRQLHVKESLDVIRVPAVSAEQVLIERPVQTPNEWVEWIACEYYRVFQMQVHGHAEFKQIHPFLNISVMEGSGSVNGIRVRKGSHLILTSGAGDIKIEGRMELFGSTVNQKQ